MPAKIPPERLAKMLDTGEQFLLLDTRPEESYEAWHVQGATHFPFGPDESLSGEQKERLDAVVEDYDQILTICAKGISSGHFADELSEAGYDDVSVVAGGMQALSLIHI